MINELELGVKIAIIKVDRRQVIGMVNKVLFVVYTIRGVNTRIISARVASAKERMLYEYNKNNK